MAICPDRLQLHLLTLTVNQGGCSNCVLLALRRCFASSNSQGDANAIMAHKDHYQTLGVLRSASAKEIKAAFFELSKVRS